MISCTCRMFKKVCIFNLKLEQTITDPLLAVNSVTAQFTVDGKNPCILVKLPRADKKNKKMANMSY